ncbi:MAG: DUF3800 domain-containing protein [Roseburia sp.]|nr:DUF3800 domain-containing protein [Roseburia sp.]
MNIYIDESGSINNHSLHVPYFVIAMIHVTEKDKLTRTYKRFVSSNYQRLLELDTNKIDAKSGQVIKQGGKIFLENYLNTQLALSQITTGKFTVKYFDSSNNKLIQIADVFSKLQLKHIPSPLPPYKGAKHNILHIG